LRRFHDSDAGYKYPDLLTYLLTKVQRMYQNSLGMMPSVVYTLTVCTTTVITGNRVRKNMSSGDSRRREVT